MIQTNYIATIVNTITTKIVSIPLIRAASLIMYIEARLLVDYKRTSSVGSLERCLRSLRIDYSTRNPRNPHTTNVVNAVNSLRLEVGLSSKIARAVRGIDLNLANQYASTRAEI